MFFASHILLDAASVLIIAVFALILYFKYSYTYWKKRNVPHIEPTFPFGNIQSPLSRTQSVAMDVKDIYNKMKSKGHKFVGLYMLHDPVFMPIDTELVKNIMTRDFGHFVNHGVYYNEKADPLSAHLFAIEDEKWRNLRMRLTPIFTSGKLKMMFDTFVDCAEPLKQEIDRLHINKEELDIKELVARFTTDIIGSCAFGIDCNSFKDPDAEFRKFGKKTFDQSFRFTLFVLLVFPKFARATGFKQTEDDVSEFFLNMVKNTVENRETTKIRRNDFMQLLVDLKNNGGSEKRDGSSLTLNELAAQAFVFFLAGFETSSTTLTYCLYELSQNKGVQDKVREEIASVLAKHDGKITYQSCSEMKYLEQTINETLRKYPPVPLLNRICTKDYQVPDADVLIEKGTKVFISAYAIQHDSEFYPEPEKFNPDRFSDENKGNIVPYTFLPFGEGPRICIGLRFGLLQIKVGLISILKNYKLNLSPRTPTPITQNPNSIVLANKEKIYLRTEKVI